MATAALVFRLKIVRPKKAQSTSFGATNSFPNIYIGRHLHLLPINNTWGLSQIWSLQHPPKKKNPFKMATFCRKSLWSWGPFRAFWKNINVNLHPNKPCRPGTKSFEMACSSGCESSDASNSMGTTPCNVKWSNEWSHVKDSPWIPWGQRNCLCGFEE